MKILMATKSLSTPYGIQRIVVQLSSALAKLGHQVHLLYFSKNIFEDTLDKAGVTYQRVYPTPSYYKPWSYRKPVQSVLDICNQFQPDVLHTHDERIDILGQQVTLKNGLPHVVTFHSNDVWNIVDEFHGRKWWDIRNGGTAIRVLLRKRWLRKGNPTLIAVSKQTAQYAAQGLNIDSVRVLHNGLEVEQFGPSKWADRNYVPQKFILITVSRLVQTKGVDVVIAALTRPELIDLPVELWLVGDGMLRQKLEEQVRLSGQEARVKFLGVRDDVPDLLRQADIYVHPARTDPFPGAVLEAICTGLPIIITRETGTVDVIEQIPELGQIVSGGNVDELTKAIARLVQNSQECQRQADLSLQCAKSLTIETMAQKYVEIYNSLIF